MFIYKTTNNINGKQYIGLCTRNDPFYLGSGVLLKDAIKIYGKENFTREILEECDDFDTLLEREMYWIEKFDAVNSEKFYNLSYGGYAGNSQIVKEYWDSLTPEQRKTCRNWKPHFKGLDQSGDKHISKIDPEWSEKVSRGVKADWERMTPEQRKNKLRGAHAWNRSGKNNPMYGRSAVKEKNLKWYTNGTDNLYITENTEPVGYRRGRTIKRKEVKADYGKI
jgi:hypothetical protein